MVVGLNLLKKTLFSLEERMQMLQRLLVDELASNVVLDSWEGLISEYAKKNGCGVLLRSVRSMADVPYEQMMAAMNSRLGNPLETMIMFSSPELSDISSSAVRELVGPEMPIAVTLDLLGNIGPAIVEQSTIIVGYDTYPHLI